MKMKKAFFFATIFMFCALLVAPAAMAQIDISGPLGDVGGGIYGSQVPTKSLPVVVGEIISVVLGFLGVVLVLIIIYAGFLYMTAGGNPEKVDKAKSWIINAIIGLIIILLAYSITGFVVNSLIQATGGAQ